MIPRIRRLNPRKQSAVVTAFALMVSFPGCEVGPGQTLAPLNPENIKSITVYLPASSSTVLPNGLQLRDRARIIEVINFFNARRDRYYPTSGSPAAVLHFDFFGEGKYDLHKTYEIGIDQEVFSESPGDEFIRGPDSHGSTLIELCRQLDDRIFKECKMFVSRYSERV